MATVAFRAMIVIEGVVAVAGNGKNGPWKTVNHPLLDMIGDWTRSRAAVMSRQTFAVDPSRSAHYPERAPAGRMLDEHRLSVLADLPACVPAEAEAGLSRSGQVCSRNES